MEQRWKVVPAQNLEAILTNMRAEKVELAAAVFKGGPVCSGRSGVQKKVMWMMGVDGTWLRALCFMVDLIQFFKCIPEERRSSLFYRTSAGLAALRESDMIC